MACRQVSHKSPYWFGRSHSGQQYTVSSISGSRTSNISVLRFSGTFHSLQAVIYSGNPYCHSFIGGCLAWIVFPVRLYSQRVCAPVGLSMSNYLLSIFPFTTLSYSLIYACQALFFYIFTNIQSHYTFILLSIRALLLSISPFPRPSVYLYDYATLFPVFSITFPINLTY